MADKKKIVPVTKPLDPTQPVMLDRAEINAIRNVYHGNAKPEEMRRAMEAIIQKLCLTNAWAWQDDQSKKDIFLGRQFVGQQIVSYLTMPLSMLKDVYDDRPG